MSLDEKEVSKGSGTTQGYSVEARYPSHLGPEVIGGMILYEKWKRVHYDQTSNNIGVPIHCKTLSTHGYLSWAAANSLRWWFIASLDHKSWGVETRIVQYSIQTTHSVTRVAEFDEIKHCVETEERNKLKVTK
jgi:hypothetical protein